IICGNRPVSLDTFPIIGRTSLEGLSIVSGTYRDGLLLAPYIGEYLSYLLLGKSIPEGQYTAFNYFPAERFPINAYTREEAIEEAVQHFVSGTYEHGIVMPLVGWIDFYERVLKENFTMLYESFGEDCVL